MFPLGISKASRRQFLQATTAMTTMSAIPWSAAKRPPLVYMVTFRGETDVDLGFIEYFKTRGVRLEYIKQDIGQDTRKLATIRADIRRVRPDLIYTWGTTVTLGIIGNIDTVKPNDYIHDIPVVFTLVASPIEAKITAKLASSGRNVTGIYHVASLEAQVRAMSSYRPFKRIGVLYTPTEDNSRVTVTELTLLSHKLGFDVIAIPFSRNTAGVITAEGSEAYLKTLQKEGAEWLYLPPDSFLGQQARTRIIPFAHGLKLPTFASTQQLMEAGALAGLVSNYRGIGNFTAYKASQILLERRSPQSIPIETLTRFTFQVSLATAKQLDLLPPLQMFNYVEFTDA